MKIKNIKKIEHTSLRYDIEVKNTHNFYANNILVHNSSATIFCRKNSYGLWEVGVCSREMEKKLEQKQTDQYVDVNEKVYTRFFHRERNCRGWFNEDTQLFYTQEEIDVLFEKGEFTIIQTDVRDSWVDLANKYHLIENLPKFCEEIDKPLALRGEINGQGLKGSGNKNNPHAKLPANLILFGVDDLSSGVAVRVPFYGSDVYGLKQVSERFNVPYAELINENVYSSIEELLTEINDYFKYEKEVNGRLLEGVVLRTLNSNNLSVKIMNPEYDSKF